MMNGVKRVSLVASVLYMSTVCTNSKSADESNTGALLKFPYITNESSPLFNQEWEVSPAHYGIHDYGGSLTAWLVIPSNESLHEYCESDNKDNNDYIHWVDDWNVEDNENLFMMLIDRGSCYFVDKSEHAQQIGASAAIILDTVNEGLFNMWEPENYDDDLDIPSVLLGENNAETLMNALRVEHWNTHRLSYPSVSNFVKVLAVLEWGLPHDDDRVEYELWTSAIDEGARLFKRHWRNTAIYMDYNNYTLFTPHVYILDGSHWRCNDGRYRCGNQCTNEGRYCAVDPESDLDYGVSGMDVVQENLRSMCVWQYIKLDNDNDNDQDHNESIWWDYANRWDHNCANESSTFNEECSFSQMDLVVNGLSNYVSNCIDESGGYGYKSGVNTILHSEMELRYNMSVYHLPTVMVNEFDVQGNIDCDEITMEDCQVLDAICAGFLDGTAPPQCGVTPAPTPEVCPDEDKDCRGVCYGRYVEDACGKCLPDGDARLNDCVDCNGEPNGYAKLDCDGVCGGPMRVNDCGYCLDEDSEDWEDKGKDCRGNCTDTYVIDGCGQCRSVDDPNYDDCLNESDNGSGNNNSGSATAAIVISVVAFLLLAIAGVALYRLWSRQREVDQQFTSIMQTYNLMDDRSTGGNVQGKSSLPIPDEDPEDVEDED